MGRFPLPPNDALPRKITLTLPSSFLDNFSFPYDRRDYAQEDGNVDMQVDLRQGGRKRGKGGVEKGGGRDHGDTWGAQSYGAKQTFGHIIGIVRKKQEVMTMFSSFGYERQKGLVDVAVGYLEEGTDSDACVTSCKVLDLFIKALKKGSIGGGGVKGDKKLVRRVMKRLTKVRDETEFMTLRGMV
ncbi:hypothetical protein TrRE_jg5583, partial [Triparma retinervis]